VATQFDVERALWDARPGEQVSVHVVRGGRELTVSLTLASDPSAVAVVGPPARR
jgi:S1-C subfamily serine protease